jgi:hypothetical protein
MSAVASQINAKIYNKVEAMGIVVKTRLPGDGVSSGLGFVDLVVAWAFRLLEKD